MKFRCRLLPENLYAVADAIQKLAAEDTKKNADLAKQEWERVTELCTENFFGGAVA